MEKIGERLKEMHAKEARRLFGEWVK